MPLKGRAGLGHKRAYAQLNMVEPFFAFCFLEINMLYLLYETDYLLRVMLGFRGKPDHEIEFYVRDFMAGENTHCPEQLII